MHPWSRAADEEPDTQKAFQIVKGAYVECHKLGFAMGFLPKDYGGGGVSNVDLQIVAEEITAVDPGFATILLVNGLGADAARLVRIGRAEAQVARRSHQRSARRISSPDGP